MLDYNILNFCTYHVFKCYRTPASIFGFLIFKPAKANFNKEGEGEGVCACKIN